MAASTPATPVVRLLALDPETGAAETGADPMVGPLRKIGDLAALPDGRPVATGARSALVVFRVPGLER